MTSDKPAHGQLNDNGPSASATGARVSLFARAMYVCALVELACGLVFIATGPVLSGIPWILACIGTVLATRAYVRGFRRRGAHDWRYSWPSLRDRIRRQDSR